MQHIRGQFLKDRAPEFAGMILILTTAAFVWLANEYQNQIQWVQHTLEVEKQIGRLWSNLLQAETGQRGYLLTGLKPFLDPYNEAVRVIPLDIDNLRVLTADNLKQQDLMAKVKPAIETRMLKLQEVIQGYEIGHPDLNNLSIGKSLMEQISQNLDAMRGGEAKLLAERSGRARSLMLAALLAAIAAALVSAFTIWAWLSATRRSNRELLALNSDLVQANIELEAGESKIRHLQKMESLGQLTGGVAHDFNNMLAVVIGGLGVAKRRLEKGDSNIQSLIDGALDGAHRAAALTKRLLAFSRQQPLEPQLVQANKLVSGMSEMIARTLGGTIRTETVLAGGLWTIHADSSQLESALLNLCVNARDAMNEGGRLTIETANGHLDDAYATAHTEVAAGQYVMIAVSDTGSGMTPETAAKAFDPFFTTKGAGKGTGLGLSQVHGFVKQSGGHIKIYSEPGNGTTVKMYFPRVYRADTDINTVSKGSEVKRLPMGKADQLILVVEDDAKVREVTLSMLRDLGYSTIHAEGAGTALRQLDDHPNVTLLFTDIVMPDVNGRKLADEALKRRPELKVLFTTGFTKNAVVHNGVLDAGVQLLQKPFSIEELASKIKVLLSARDLSDTGVPH
jgi:signal transduction histidine kinase/CheY-like chemotaxis protein